MTSRISLALSAFLLAGTALSSAQAADLPSSKYTPVAPMMTQSPWMVRVRGVYVLPEEKASLNLLGVTPLVGADVNISASVVPELDITYFFTKNIAAELILGVTPHTVKGAGTLAGVRIGSTVLLPPTLTLQYHFTDFGAFKPYVGAGINYTFFLDEKAKGGFDKFDLEDNFGFALQAGFDYMIDKNWGFNFDVKKIFLESKVKVNDGLVQGKVKIDPWLIAAGVTYRF